MNTTPKKEYGWVIIDTPEKKAQFGPRKAGDQYYGGIGNCLHWEEAVWSSDSSKTSVGCAGSPFSESDIYRRRIDPGKGYEIVPGETFETADMEFTRDGVAWRSNAQAATYAMRCADYPDRSDRWKLICVC